MAKFGVRKPSIKKSIKARTTGKIKRRAKKAVIPMYGKKGSGWVKNPKKAAYNKVYNKTSISIFDLVHSKKHNRKKNSSLFVTSSNNNYEEGNRSCGCCFLALTIPILLFLLPFIPLVVIPTLLLIFFGCIIAFIVKLGKRPDQDEVTNYKFDSKGYVDPDDDNWADF